MYSPANISIVDQCAMDYCSLGYIYIYTHGWAGILNLDKH